MLGEKAFNRELFLKRKYSAHREVNVAKTKVYDFMHSVSDVK